VARWVAPVYAFLRPGMRRNVQQGMDRLLAEHDLTDSTAALAREFVARDFCKVMDDLAVYRLHVTSLQKLVTIDGLEQLEQARRDGHGAIVLTGHFHANRLAKHYLRQIGYPFLNVRNEVPWVPNLGKFGARFVAPAYGRMIATLIEDELHEAHSGLGVGLLRHLRENGIVTIHIDGSMSLENNFHLPLFGLDWPFAGGFIRLAEISGAPLIPMLCLGDNTRISIRFGEPIHFHGRSSPEQRFQRLRPLARQLQTWIGGYPSEWELWSRLKYYFPKEFSP